MAEYIEREAALSAQNKSMNLSEMRKRLERIPAADVRPVAKAHWIKCNRGAGYKCSVCKARVSIADVINGNHNYCYKCGAMMEES